MNTHTQNVLETPTSSRKLTLVAIILILQVIGISGAFAHLDPVGVAVSEAQSAECSTATLPHFPLQAGNQWSYTKKGPGGDEAWQVAVVTRADGGTASELQGYFGSTHTVCSATSGTVFSRLPDWSKNCTTSCSARQTARKSPQVNLMPTRNLSRNRTVRWKERGS